MSTNVAFVTIECGLTNCRKPVRNSSDSGSGTKQTEVGRQSMSAPLRRAHHRPRFRDSGPYSRSSCGQAGAELLEDSPFSYRLELAWSFGVNAYHRSMHQGQSS